MRKMKNLFSITFAISFLLITACEKAPETTPEAPPVASFSVSTDFARPGEAVLFQNTSEGAKTFTWDFGDGNSSNEENPSHIYTETGTYTIQLEVTNSEGSDEVSREVLITLWSIGTAMPTGRWSLNICVVDGKIYAIGGGTNYGNGALATMEVYDPVTDTWSARSEMPTPRQASASCVVDGKIYVTGGGETPRLTNYIGVEAFTTVEEYDPATDTWTEKTPMPRERWVHSACAVDGKIYIIGGCGSDSYPNWNNFIALMEMYDPVTDTWTQVGNIPRPMIGSGCAVIDGKIYMIGGKLEEYDKRVDEYDPETDTWTPKTDLLSSRASFGCCVMNDKIYVIGGDGGHDVSVKDLLDIYDPANDTWTIGTPLSSPRWGLGSCTVDGKIYAIGGLYSNNNSATKKVEVYYE